jgi:hypothetical protein
MHRGEEKRLKVNNSVECKRPLIPLYAANEKNLEASIDYRQYSRHLKICRIAPIVFFRQS